MIHRHLFLALALMLCLSMDATGGLKPSASREPRHFSPTDEVIPGIVILKVRPEIDVTDLSVTTSSPALTAALQSNGVIALSRMFKSLPRISPQERADGFVDLSLVYYAQIDPSLDPREVAGRLSVLEELEYVEPKYMDYLAIVPNDPLLPANQNNMFTRMNAYNGWDIARGDSNVVIATIDGGTYWQHEDLSPNLWINSPEDLNGNGRFDPGPPPAGDEDGIDQDGNGFVDDVIGWNFANNTNNPAGLAGTPQNAAHGTATASHSSARTNNGIGMAGSSWNCRLLPVNVGSPTTDNAIAFGYEGIVYAYMNGAHVINCSWGRVGGFSFFQQDVINAATQAGALVVAAAGNGGADFVGDNNDLTPHYPSNYRNVLAVGATNQTSDVKAGFSNFGLTVPVYAPGVNIFSAFTNGGYGNGGSGTSYSSPLTAGLAGIVKSQNPTWTPRQIATQIRVTADSIDAANPSFSGRMGRGRINFARALSESHPGIEILSSSLLTTQGSNIFLPGDTVVLSLSVQNILFTTANNLSFTATTSSASLQVLQGSANAGTLAPGAQVTLPQFRFRVGTITSSLDVLIKLEWVSNGNARDAYAFKATIFPSTPFWVTQVSPTSLPLYSIKAVSNQVAWAAGTNSSGTPVVVRTTDGGNTWMLATGNLASMDLYCITALDGERAWVGTGNGRLFATTTGGASWSQQTYPGTQSPFINGITMFPSGTGYAQGDPASGGRFVVLKTTDFGTTWTHLANEPVGTSAEAGWNNSWWWTDQNRGWFGTNQNKVWRTTDGGATWSSATSGATNSYGVAFKDANNGIVIHSNGVVRVSTNGGGTWNAATSPTSAALVGVAFLPGTNSAWMASGTTSYRSTNNGSSWFAQSQYPFGGSLTHLSFVDTTYGWAVTGSGEILKYQPPGTVGVEETPGDLAPTTVLLDQNYPNPFNPTTHVGFRISRFGFVSLKVYDLLGREVATLVDDTRAAGEHVVQFDASGLPSGVYFYRLIHGNSVLTRKMMLMQ
jgi:photosystem II stability/assembly factor-like uncharacterized protein